MSIFASLLGEGPDYCCQQGAELLRARIEAYWRDRGYDVSVTLHEMGFHPAVRAVRYEVRSDMINGMPKYRLPQDVREALSQDERA